MLGRRQLLPRSRSSSRPRQPRALSIPPPSLPPPPGPPTLGVRMCSMAGPRLQGPRRARPHAPARACGAMGRAGRGLRRPREWAGPGFGSSSRCADGAGRLRGPGIAALRLLAPAGLTLGLCSPSRSCSLEEALTAQVTSYFSRWLRWRLPVIPTTQEAEAGGSFGSNSLEQ